MDLAIQQAHMPLKQRTVERALSKVRFCGLTYVKGGYYVNSVSHAIKIRNCNNVIEGEIAIEKDKLNIFYGQNGTGKSTIAKAIRLASHGQPLAALAPYGINAPNAEGNEPSISGLAYDNIAIFDIDYLEQFVFQQDTVLKDSFEILIRTPAYDTAKENIDVALTQLRSILTTEKRIVALQEQVSILISNIEITSRDQLAKRKTGIKSVLSGKGGYFSPPPSLQDLAPFFEEESVTKWAPWRLQGQEQFGARGRCPYCAADETEKNRTMNQDFSANFDKASVEFVAVLRGALEGLACYLSTAKVKGLLSLFGTKAGAAAEALEAELLKLGAEARYLDSKLTGLLSFNGLSVDRDGLSTLEQTLNNMRIDGNVLDTYFCGEGTTSVLDTISEEIDNLLRTINELKAEIGKCNKYVQEQTADREKDINEFLAIAGFKYVFKVVIDGEDNARAVLKFVKPDGENVDIQKPARHLSWGEKHAFALILFMFDAISRNADLVILDDPISSFDSNKKYAIMNRLFKTRDKENSLYQRTVMLLTHDLQPVIDYVQVSARQDPLSVRASYLENIDGKLYESVIERDKDLMSHVVLLKEMACDTSLDLVARIGCLRKYIEHTNKDPKSNSDAYNVLSSLVHGRCAPTYDREGENPLGPCRVKVACEEIKNYIPDFDYADSLDACDPLRLLERYAVERNSYVKLLLLRAYIERSMGARDRLRKANDVLLKYVDETYHIENDYLYSLDVRRFSIVPDYHIRAANEFIAGEKARV